MTKPHLPLRVRLFSSLTAAVLAATSARADYNPVALTPGSFAFDIVVEKTSPPPLGNFVNATIDNGTNNTGNTYFEQGFVRAMPYAGLPPAGTTLNSLVSGHTYVMPPTYATNNAAFVGSATIPGNTNSPSTLVTQVLSGAFNVISPVPGYQTISVLYGAGGNGGAVSVTVNYSDGSSDSSQTISTVDWFNAAAAAYSALGRVSIDGGSANLNNFRNSGNCKLFAADIPVNNAKTVTNLTFNFTGAGSTANYRFAAFALSGSTDGANFTPMPVSGFNRDLVVEASAHFKGNYTEGITVSMDNGANANGNTFYEQGFGATIGQTNINRGGLADPGTTGLPHPGGNISASVTGTNYLFRMASSYSNFNCVFIANTGAGAVTNGPYGSPNYTSGAFGITSPQSGYNGYVVLCSAGNGPLNINYSINYDDGTSDPGSISVLDWFNGAAVRVFNTAGRAAPDGPAINNVNGNPAGALWADVMPANAAKTATNISFSYVGGGRGPLFALSAATDGLNFTNVIGVSGYNADIIFEKEQPPYNGGLFTQTTATMDLGVQNGNFTWFEKGWLTNGIGVNSGLPPSGSTIASLQAANRFYQMPNYTAKNGILINSSTTNASATPASPATYSAFAILTAAGSVGAGNTMTNLCILQHADGVNETNNFFGKDWFDNTIPPALIANGRADTRNGSVTSMTGPANLGAVQDPRLFESFFQVTDVGSPVTNIVFQWKSGGGSCYIMAVSATAGAVQPFVGPITPIPASPIMEGSNVVMSVTEGGTAPVTNQWQFSSDGGATWVNLVDGGSIAGSATTSLQINGANYLNSGSYRIIASNVAGVITNLSITYNVYSVLPDVTANTDPVTAYQPNGGNSPAGFEVIHAIENLVGTNGTYLNNGQNGGSSPFVGPVGFVVAPRAGKTTVTAARFYTAEANAANDPANWMLEGSNDGSTWTPITAGALGLPGGRNAIAAAGVNPLTQALVEKHFANSVGYTSYRVTFSNTVNDAVATGIQIGEVELLGTNTYTAPLIVQQPANATVWQGGNPSFTVVAVGAPAPLTYQWFRGVNPIGGATGSRYTLVNAQPGDSGATFSCTVADTQGSTPSASATLTVSGTTPTIAYPAAVLADQPLGLWRLGEADNGSGNNGIVAVDSFGGFNGVYSNTVLAQPGYNPSLDSDTAGRFGDSINSYVDAIQGIDFSKPTNTSAAFSIEAWTLWTAGVVPFTDAGIITKGYGGGGEQFNLDTGGGGGHFFRFFVRDAAGNTHGANGTIGPTNQTGPFPFANSGQFSWHHVVGVCDEAHSNVVLYVDGISNAATSVLPSNGILSSPLPITIGSRTPNIFSEFTNQFLGEIDEVAIYPFALSPSQVLNHYFAAQPMPVFTLQPTNTDFSDGGSLVLRSSAYGPSLTYQWYQSPDQSTWSAVGGQTSATFNNPSTPNTFGPFVELVATDPYGSTTSSVVQVTVHSGAPIILTDLTPTNGVYPLGNVSLAVAAYGTAPVTFLWFKSSDNVTYTALSDNAHFSGSHSNVLSVANALSSDTAFYKVVVSNGSGSVESVHEYLIVSGTLQFFGNGPGWSKNGDTVNAGAAGSISNGVFTPTDGTGGESRSVWYSTPMYVGAFQASFTYQDIGGGGADGSAFAIQNQGPTALGGGGGGIAYSGITPSVALMIDIYNGAPGGPYNNGGVLLDVNGLAVSASNPFYQPGLLNIDAGNPINVTLRYVG
ncbi:MAG TPA: hypothetical protein VLT36_09655, partial [Candidatus Dormibacteraeota bacterium]|nr:hypothetical protein [Candidatus Dormibacteraeota bacterium]